MRLVGHVVAFRETFEAEGEEGVVDGAGTTAVIEGGTGMSSSTAFETTVAESATGIAIAIGKGTEIGGIETFDPDARHHQYQEQGRHLRTVMGETGHSASKPIALEEDLAMQDPHPRGRQTRIPHSACPPSLAVGAFAGVGVAEATGARNGAAAGHLSMIVAIDTRAVDLRKGAGVGIVTSATHTEAIDTPRRSLGETLAMIPRGSENCFAKRSKHARHRTRQDSREKRRRLLLRLPHRPTEPRQIAT